MEAKCKKCGKPLHDPVSIARGMGPGCAGITSNGKGHSLRRRSHRGTAYSRVGDNPATLNLVSLAEEIQSRIPEVLQVYPPDLVDLVLSASQPGSIATRIRRCSGGEQNKVPPIKLLKQIRRTCIEHRLLFWPGLSMNLEPMACIPHGEDGWKIGESGRVINKDELLVYLGRYGIIAQEQFQTTV